MGTRGMIGVRINGQDKAHYKQFDCYPTAQGVELLAQLRQIHKEHGWGWLKEHAAVLRCVTTETIATPEEIETFKQYANTKVSSQQITEWYVLLRELQGELYTTLKAGVILDQHKFIVDSLFCEWAYLVNVDEMTIEIYKGFQKEPHSKGRYTTKEPDEEYYPCALVATYKLDDLPTDSVFLSEVDTNDD
jgi:hypothetical protein